jgi:hypothetical protein
MAFDGVAGSMGHDQGADHHEGAKAQRQAREADGVQRVVGDRQDGCQDDADDEDRQH